MTAENKRDELERFMAEYPVALDPDQVAEILGITRRTVDKLLDDNKLEYFAIDPGAERKQKRVTKAELVAYMLDNHITN